MFFLSPTLPPSQIFSNKHAQHNPRPKSSKTSKTCNRINRHQSAGSRLDFFLSEFHLWFLDSVQTCMMNSLYDFLRTHAAFRSSFVTHWSSLFCTQSVFAVLFFSAADCSVCSSQLPTLPLFYPEIDSTLKIREPQNHDHPTQSDIQKLLSYFGIFFLIHYVSLSQK